MDPRERREIGNTGLMVSRLGLGGSSLGGMYTESSDQEATEVVNAFSDLGLNFIDTAPSYGYGLSEERIGRAISSIPRERLILSSKVGELVVSDGTPPPTGLFKGVGERSKVWDFSRDGVYRSYESSLKRLGVDSLDILLIHDPYRERADQAIGEAFPACDELRSSGAVKAIGVGMGGTNVLSRFARECDLDCILSYGSYSLINSEADDEFFPLCADKRISIILGAPFDSGILASDLTGDVKYHYHDAPPEIVTHARKAQAVCLSHGVPLKAAALQYVLRHPIVATTIPGTRSAHRLRENFEMIQFYIPDAMWSELKSEGLILDDVKRGAYDPGY